MFISYIGSVTQNCLNLMQCQTDCINKSCNVNTEVNEINMGLVFCEFITDFDFCKHFLVWKCPLFFKKRKRSTDCIYIYNILKCMKLHERIHITVILHIYGKGALSVHGRWFQRKSSRAGIKKQFSASLKWGSIFGSHILTPSSQTNERGVLWGCYGNVSFNWSWAACSAKGRNEDVDSGDSPAVLAAAGSGAAVCRDKACCQLMAVLVWLRITGNLIGNNRSVASSGFGYPPTQI